MEELDKLHPEFGLLNIAAPPGPKRISKRLKNMV